jgi:hypothetical protein
MPWIIAQEEDRGTRYSGGRGANLAERQARSMGYPWPTFASSWPVGGTGPALRYEPVYHGEVYSGYGSPYTTTPNAGELIPNARSGLSTTAAFPSGAAAPNVSDPILSGSRSDPFGYTKPFFAETGSALAAWKAAKAAAALAVSYADAAARSARGFSRPG